MIPIPVHPSGGDDTQTIQAAFDKAVLPSGGFDQGAVEFEDSVYKITKPLVCGTKAGRAVSILAHHAVIQYVGPLTSDYAVRIAGEGRTASLSWGGLWLDCNNRCRGLLATHQTYAAEFSHLYIRDAREIALDFVGCWGSWLHDCVVANCHGIGLRLWGHNSTRVDGIKLHGTGDAWPAEDDTSVTDWRGRYVQTPDQERALVVCREMDKLTGNCWCIEGVKYAGRPLIYGRMYDSRLSNVRVETCVCSMPTDIVGSNNEVTNLTIARQPPPPDAAGIRRANDSSLRRVNDAA